LRKKFATVGHAKATTKAQVQTFFERCGPVYNFVGKAAKQHRLFVFSCDTFFEGAALASPQGKPWSTPAVLGANVDALLEFMIAQMGPADVLLIADGRSRACRKKVEVFAEKTRNMNEIWVVYKPTSRLGRSVFSSADTRETMWVSMPCNNTLIPCKTRDGYNVAGETSTHDTTYTGVEPMPWPAMPLISLEDKAKVHGVPPATPRPQLFDASLGLPLFWQERKTPSFWAQILRDLDAKAVFDLTPSGSLGRACLAEGVLYTALAKNAEHNSWLQNLFDRAAVSLIASSGSPLYEQDLSQLISDHFQDVLDQLHEQDACEDTVPDDQDATTNADA